MNPARLVCQLAEDTGQPRHQRVDDHLPSQPFGLLHRLPGRVDCSGGQGLTPGGCLSASLALAQASSCSWEISFLLEETDCLCLTGIGVGGGRGVEGRQSFPLLGWEDLDTE